MIGCDITQISKIEDIIARNGQAFLDKVFSDAEILYAESSERLKFQRYAVRFAAKEAVVKAFGTGFRSLSWKDISIDKGKLGNPFVVLSDKAKLYCQQNGIKDIHISLSHTSDNAMAVAYLEK